MREIFKFDTHIRYMYFIFYEKKYMCIQLCFQNRLILGAILYNNIESFQ